MPSRIVERLERQEAKLESWIRDLDDIIVQDSVRISQILIAGFYAALRKDFPAAESSLDRATCFVEGRLEAGSKGDTDYLDAYQYLIHANRIHVLMMAEKGSEAKVLFQLTTRMNLFSNKAKAAFLVMKAIFLGHLGMNQKKLALLRKVRHAALRNI
jgi:hypothetical protein